VSGRDLAEEERSSNRATHERELHALPSPVRVHEHQPLAEARERAAADEGGALVTVEDQRPEQVGLQLTKVAAPGSAGDTSTDTARADADRLAVVPVASGGGGNPVAFTHQNDS